MRGKIQRFKGCQGDDNKTFFASLSAVCHLKREQSDVNSKLRRGLLGGVKSRRATSFRRSHRCLHFRRQLTLLCGALWRRRPAASLRYQQAAAGRNQNCDTKSSICRSVAVSVCCFHGDGRHHVRPISHGRIFDGAIIRC